MTPEQRNNRLNTLISRLDQLRNSGALRSELTEAADLANLLVSALRFDDPERLKAEIERVCGLLPPYRKEST